MCVATPIYSISLTPLFHLSPSPSYIFHLTSRGLSEKFASPRHGYAGTGDELSPQPYALGRCQPRGPSPNTVVFGVVVRVTYPT